MTTNQTPQSNAERAISIGMNAARQWQSGASATESGDGLAIYALCVAERTMTFVAEINRGTAKEPEIEQRNFDILDMRYGNEPRQQNGDKDTKLVAAMREAVCSRVFGLSGDAIDGAMRQRFNRALLCATYILDRYRIVDDEHLLFGGKDDNGKAIEPHVTLREKVKVRHGGADKSQTCLRVPHEAVFLPPKPLAEGGDADENEQYERDRFAGRTLDGKAGRSLTELAKRANEHFGKGRQRDSGGNTEEARTATFKNSVTFLNATLARLNDPEADEADVALSKELRLDMFILSTRIAAYFADDPLEQEEQEELDKRAAA